MKKATALLLVVMLCMALAAGCDSSGSETKDTLTIMGEMLTTNFDPTFSSNVDMSMFVKMGLYDSLVKIGDEGAVTGALAKNWTVSDDGLTYTFELNEAKFHDGSDFTADDVIYTLDRSMPNPTMYIFPASIASYQKVDDRTVEITRLNTTVELLNILAMYFTVIPQATHSADPDAFAKSPIGTGPYQYVSSEADGTVTMVANDNYFMGKPYFKNYKVMAPVDPSTAVVNLETGNVDILVGIPSAQIKAVQDNEKLTYVSHESWNVMSLMFFDKGLAQDVNLRKAFYHGIDREKIITLATEGTATQSENLYSPLTLKGLAGAVDMVGYDFDLASQYLAQSNYQAGDEITLVVMAAQANDAQAIQSDMAKLGVTVKIESLDMNAWSTKVYGGEAQMTAIGLGSIAASLTDLMDGWTSTNPYWGPLVATSAEYDGLMAQAKAATDEAARNDLLKQALQITYDQAVLADLYVLSANIGYSNQLTGIPSITPASGLLYPGDIRAK